MLGTLSFLSTLGTLLISVITYDIGSGTFDGLGEGNLASLFYLGSFLIYVATPLSALGTFMITGIITGETFVLGVNLSCVTIFDEFNIE